jgi:hypothetical protein
VHDLFTGSWNLGYNRGPAFSSHVDVLQLEDARLMASKIGETTRAGWDLDDWSAVKKVTRPAGRAVGGWWA